MGLLQKGEYRVVGPDERLVEGDALLHILSDSLVGDLSAGHGLIGFRRDDWVRPDNSVYHVVRKIRAPAVVASVTYGTLLLTSAAEWIDPTVISDLINEIAAPEPKVTCPCGKHQIDAGADPQKAHREYVFGPDGIMTEPPSHLDWAKPVGASARVEFVPQADDMYEP